MLVDRVWPRGVRKESLADATWMRDVAPSTGLRKWFGHDAARWDEFRRRYRAELAKIPETWAPLIEMIQKSEVTLLFSARDVERNQAVVLKEFLDARRRP